MIRHVFAALRRRSRARRYGHLHDVLKLDAQTGPILDLGGGPASFFAAMFPRGNQIVLVDIDYAAARRARQRLPALGVVVADGERLPFPDGAFAATVCNSVIEHVDHPGRLAAEIRRVSRTYFVQTPNGRFPLETHSHIAIPFYNWIRWPRVRRWVCRPFGASYTYVDSVRYLTEARLQELFPDAVQASEKVLGMRKSFYIYR